MGNTQSIPAFSILSLGSKSRAESPCPIMRYCLKYDNTWNCHNANTFSFDPVHPSTSIRIFKKAATSVLAAALNDQRDSSLYFITQISNKLSQEKATSFYNIWWFLFPFRYPGSSYRLQTYPCIAKTGVQSDCFPEFTAHAFPYPSKSTYKRRWTSPLQRSIRLARRARCLSLPRAWRGQRQAPPEAPGR